MLFRLLKMGGPCSWFGNSGDVTAADPATPIEMDILNHEGGNYCRSRTMLNPWMTDSGDVIRFRGKTIQRNGTLTIEGEKFIHLATELYLSTYRTACLKAVLQVTFAVRDTIDRCEAYDIRLLVPRNFLIDALAEDEWLTSPDVHPPQPQRKRRQSKIDPASRLAALALTASVAMSADASRRRLTIVTCGGPPASFHPLITETAKGMPEKLTCADRRRFRRSGRTMGQQNLDWVLGNRTYSHESFLMHRLALRMAARQHSPSSYAHKSPQAGCGLPGPTPTAATATSPPCLQRYHDGRKPLDTGRAGDQTHLHSCCMCEAPHGGSMQVAQSNRKLGVPQALADVILRQGDIQRFHDIAGGLDLHIERLTNMLALVWAIGTVVEVPAMSPLKDTSRVLRRRRKFGNSQWFADIQLAGDEVQRFHDIATWLDRWSELLMNAMSLESATASV